MGDSSLILTGLSVVCDLMRDDPSSSSLSSSPAFLDFTLRCLERLLGALQVANAQQGPPLLPLPTEERHWRIFEFTFYFWETLLMRNVHSFRMFLIPVCCPPLFSSLLHPHPFGSPPFSLVQGNIWPIIVPATQLLLSRHYLDGLVYLLPLLAGCLQDCDPLGELLELCRKRGLWRALLEARGWIPEEEERLKQSLEKIISRLR